MTIPRATGGGLACAVDWPRSVHSPSLTTALGELKRWGCVRHMIVELIYRLVALAQGGRMPARATAMQLYGPSAKPTAAQEAAFFGGLRLANGTFKTTSENRLNDLNALVGSALPARRPLRVKDVGISSGVTTAEWVDQLRAQGVELEMTGTDQSFYARLVHVAGRIRVLCDADGNLLQTDVFGYCIPRETRLPERLLYGAVVARMARGACRRPHESIRLVSPRLLGRTDVELLEEDLLDPATKRHWDVIRAANILNRGYFSIDDLKTMITGITDSLAEDGLLAVCRTDSSGANNATVFRLGRAGYEVVGRLGTGSEVEDLVLTAAGTSGIAP